MRRVILTGMVLFILVAAALPAVAVIADENFPGDTTYSTAAAQAEGEDFPGKREIRLCQNKGQLEQEECEKVRNRDG